jgi:diguanylate cyclase (GGDEF)-like protein
MLLRHLAARGALSGANGALMIDPPPRAPAQAPAAAAELESLPILASIGEVFYEWDLRTDLLAWGGDLEKTLGLLAKADLSSGMAYGAHLAPESAVSRYDAVMRSDGTDDGDGVPYQLVYGLMQPRDLGGVGVVWVEDTGRWFKGDDGRPARAHGVVRVVTERHDAEKMRAHSTQFDALTGLLNRAHLTDKLQRLIDNAERSRKPFGVLLVALENLFTLNRNYGYDAGDEVIAGLAQRLTATMRVSDLLARHAGNKFAIVAPECDSEQVQVIAARLIETVAATPFETSAGAVPATIRVGGVVGPREGRTTHTLFQHAEEALDAARQSVESRFALYSASLTLGDQRMHARNVAESIVSALRQERVELAYQPIVRGRDGQIAFHEALLRVRLPDGSTVSPGELLPVAEKAGLVRLLDWRVMELVVAALAESPSLRVSVNASLSTVLDPEWPQRLTALIEAHPGLASRLTIELTETSVIEDIAATSNVIAVCHALGAKVAMDDFGAGHTSFRNLRALAFDLVKIDGAFIRNIVNSEDDRFFARTLTELAHHLKLEIVAEWVEDEGTAALLREWKVDYFQGALFGDAVAGPK